MSLPLSPRVRRAREWIRRDDPTSHDDTDVVLERAADPGASGAAPVREARLRHVMQQLVKGTSPLAGDRGRRAASAPRSLRRLHRSPPIAVMPTPGARRPDGGRARRVARPRQRAARGQGRLHAPHQRRARVIGSFAIIGARLTIATGAAWSAHPRGSGRSPSAFGDSTTNIGPSRGAERRRGFRSRGLRVREQPVHRSPRSPSRPFPVRSGSLPVVRPRTDLVDGNNTDAVHLDTDRMLSARPVATGPVIVEALTYRHQRPLAGRSRRIPNRGRLEAWLGYDPLTTYRGTLSDSASRRQHRRHRLRRRDPVDTATTAAKAGPLPDPAAASPTCGPTGATHGAPDLSRRRLAQHRSGIEHDESVVLIGEDIAAAGGVFKTTDGTARALRPRRVIDTPIPSRRSSAPRSAPP